MRYSPDRRLYSRADWLDEFSLNTQATDWIEVKKKVPFRFAYFFHAFPINK